MADNIDITINEIAENIDIVVNPNLIEVNITKIDGANVDNLVPYIGATDDVNLGSFDLTANNANIDVVNFDLDPIVPTSVGSLYWDNVSKTLSLIDGVGATTLQIGQEERVLVKNTTGSTLTDGQIVYITGATGNLPSVSLASALNENTSAATLGMVTETITNGSSGFVTITGLVNGLNTLSFNEGDIVWLSNTAGEFTNIKPTSPSHLVLIGYVTKKSAQGSIYVKIQNTQELNECSDVFFGTLSNNDLLIYESATGLWKNKQLSTLLGGASSDFVKGDGSLDSTTYATQSALNTEITNRISGDAATLASANNYTNAGLATKQAALNGTGFVKINGTTISYDNGTYYPNSNPNGYTSNLGTVTSVGTSAPLTGGTITGTGTIGITQANTTTNGYLSSTDWNTFNNKQNALTNPITGTGTGTTNTIPKFTGVNALGNSTLSDNGTIVNTTGSLTANVEVQAGSNTQTGASLIINGASGSIRTISMRTAGSRRWGWRLDNTAEAGSNAGSDLRLTSYTDANAQLSDVLFVKRSTGTISIGTTVAPYSNILNTQGGIYNQSTDGAGLILRTLSNGTTASPIENSILWKSNSPADVASINVEDARTNVSGVPMIFSTRNNSNVYAERFRIDNLGNVGFGTTTPIGKVNIFTGITGADFSMSGQQNGSISFSNAGTVTAIPTMSSKSNDGTGLLFIAGTNDVNSSPDMRFDARTNTSTDFTTLTTPAFKFTRAGNSLIDILRNGNVLIGTTSDNGTGKLQVNGTVTAPTFIGALTGNASTATTLQTARTINGVSFNGSANITVTDSTKLPLAGGTLSGALVAAQSITVPSTAGYGLTFRNVFNGNNYDAQIVSRTNSGGAATSGLLFRTGYWNGSAPVQADRMYIDAESGNVLIGTTTDDGSASKLQVNGSINITNSFFRYNNNTGVIGSGTSITGGTSSQLGIRAGNEMLFATGGSTERMRITSSGNVLIGTTSDNGTGKLQVNGSVKVANDTATASSSNVGAIRYRSDTNNSYCEQVMQTGASSYSWVIIKQNTW